MTNLNPKICWQLRDARKAARLSQSELAREVGCKQSALSMFEQGDGTKLNDDVIKRLAAKFSIQLPTEEAKPASESATAAVLPRPVPDFTPERRGFCPNVNCPSHHAYQVDGRTFLKPDRAAQDPVGGRFCVVCGEILERVCPTCGGALHDGAICSFCGSPYLALA